MEPIEIEYYDLDSEVIEKYLKGNIFHVTPAKNYKSIINDGFIYHPNPEKYNVNFPQSKICYGYKEKCVCLLDFRNINITNPLYSTAKDQIHGKDYIFILNNTLYGNIIPPKSHEEFTKINGTHYFIPEYECWYPEKISISNICEILHIKHLETEEEKQKKGNSLLGMSLALEHRKK